MNNQIIIDGINPEKIRETLHEEIKSFNYPRLGSYELKRFAIYMQDNAKNTIAGLYGFIIDNHKTIRVELVWVKDEFRNQGLGTQLFNELERYAMTHECKVIQASTMEFQAPIFYEKIGFKLLGKIPKWFCDKDMLCFIKELI